MRVVCLAVLVASAVTVPAGGRAAEPFPQRPIRLLVPYAPGGGTDITSRMLAPRLAEFLGQQVVVDNRPGGSSILGTEIVARSIPDGHTLMTATIAFAANAGLFAKLPYDVQKDFAAVSLVGSVPMVLVAHPSVGAKTVAELVRLAKTRPGSLNYASGGTGGANHLAAELFRSMTAIQIVHIPYKGGSGIVTAVLGGEVQLGFGTISTVQAHVAAGRMIAVGATIASRIAALPNVPTIAESGVAGYEMSDWQGIVAPAGTPPAAIARLNAGVQKALSHPEVREKAVALGLDLAGSTPGQFAAHVDAEVAKWRRITREAGIKGE